MDVPNMLASWLGWPRPLKRDLIRDAGGITLDRGLHSGDRLMQEVLERWKLGLRFNIILNPLVIHSTDLRKRSKCRCVIVVVLMRLPMFCLLLVIDYGFDLVGAIARMYQYSKEIILDRLTDGRLFVVQCFWWRSRVCGIVVARRTYMKLCTVETAGH